MPIGVKGFQKGIAPRNSGRTRFKIGVIPWNKGKKGVYKEHTLLMMALAKVGANGYWNGKKRSKETIEKIRASAKKRTNHKGPKGVPWSLARRIAQENRRGKPYRTKANGGKRKCIKMRGNIYPPDWVLLRKKVYQRDKWVCQECGKHCHNRIKIQCHHIDYDTSNNVLSNLITLCASCHAKTNYNRSDWIAHYKKIKEKKNYGNI